MALLEQDQLRSVMICLREDDIEWNQATFNHWAIDFGLSDRMWVSKGRMYIRGSVFESRGRPLKPGAQVAMTRGAHHCLTTV